VRALGDATDHAHREGRQDHGAGRQFRRQELNAPNDIVAKSDDSIWFTDPLFGINGEWEGTRAKREQATTNVYRLGADGNSRP
jgi:sugar lactone lactonase YvrE